MCDSIQRVRTRFARSVPRGAKSPECATSPQQVTSFGRCGTPIANGDAPKTEVNAMQSNDTNQTPSSDSCGHSPLPADSGSPCSGLQDACSGTSASEAERLLMDSLSSDHLIHRLMTEHSEIRQNLEQLELLAEELAAPARAREEILSDIGHNATKLIGAEPHHQREEEVLFPEMANRGVFGPPEVMTAEHVTLRALKHAIQEGASTLSADSDIPTDELIRNANELVFQLRNHIFKENNILYPMALGTIRDAADWADLASRADAY